MKQLDLFGPVKPVRKLSDERRILVQTLRRAEKGGLVNGMSKAALRRYAPEKLPRVTVHD